jgi:short-subunit dehydrogenase
MGRQWTNSRSTSGSILAIKLSATFHTTRLALRARKNMGLGRIVNTGSMHARAASPDESVCVAAKNGVAAFTKAVALEVAASITGAILPIEGGWTAQYALSSPIREPPDQPGLRADSP